MFTHFVVKNFRCFAGLHLKDLQRVNLIAGMNNTGKTALLEAIHLHNNPNNCELPISISKVRGVIEPSRTPEDICAWLFWGKHAAGGMDVSSWDDKGITRTLAMWVLDTVTSRERFPEAEKRLRDSFRADIAEANLPRLILRYEQTNEAEQVAIGILGGLSYCSSSPRILWSIPSVYLGSGVPSPDQDVAYFGELEAAKRQEEILPALRILEPRLQRLSIIPLAGQPVIHGDIGLPRLVPVPFMGEGMRRVLSFVLAIANAPGGVVLIDEIENGLHHTVLKNVWQAIAQAARKADVQVFATTHSYECINAAHEAFLASGTYDFNLHRLDREEGGIEVVSYDQESIGGAMDHFMEVR
jgi:hypothetical protein